MERIAWILLCVFLILFGITAVTNITIVALSAIMGGCALVSGILFLILRVR